VKSCGLRIACILSLLWGGWWTFFGLASGIGEKSAFRGILMHALVPGLIFLATALAARKWNFIGGIFLVLEGVLCVMVFRISFGSAIHHTWVTDGLLARPFPE